MALILQAGNVVWISPCPLLSAATANVTTSQRKQLLVGHRGVGTNPGKVKVHIPGEEEKVGKDFRCTSDKNWCR